MTHVWWGTHTPARLQQVALLVLLLAGGQAGARGQVPPGPTIEEVRALWERAAPWDRRKRSG
jgi:hypothetical protein